MKKYKPILIVAGEPNSIFTEILFKSLKKIKVKSPIILICSERLFKSQMKKLKYKLKINIINKNLKNQKLSYSCLNLVNINYYQSKAFQKISTNSSNYINNCFSTAIEMIKLYKINKFINGPINKNTFLNKKHLGITEYLSNKFNLKKNAMLIYNKKLSVCPITTHLPIKLVPKNISKKIIIDKINLINEFYKKNMNFSPKIAVLGLNPHCESIENNNEDEKIIEPVINFLKKKKKYSISGPYPADTIFLTQNRKKFNVIVGMYHDQVLSPFKTLFEYDAINITLGLPFVRISPDHGHNEKMAGKNISKPLSLIKAISFLDRN